MPPPVILEQTAHRQRYAGGRQWSAFSSHQRSADARGNHHACRASDLVVPPLIQSLDRALIGNSLAAECRRRPGRHRYGTRSAGCFWRKNLRRRPPAKWKRRMRCRCRSPWCLDPRAWIPAVAAPRRLWRLARGSHCSNIVRAARTFGSKPRGLHGALDAAELPMPCSSTLELQHSCAGRVRRATSYLKRSRPCDRRRRNRHGRHRFSPSPAWYWSIDDRRIPKSGSRQQRAKPAAARIALFEDVCGLLGVIHPRLVFAGGSSPPGSQKIFISPF